MRNHFLFLLFFLSSSFPLHLWAAPAAVKVGVILDMNSTVGKTSFLSMNMAVEDFYAAHRSYTTRIFLEPRDSNRDVISAAAAAVDLLQNSQVQVIIGPQNSAESGFVVALGSKARVPVVSFSSTSPAVSASLSPFFLRTGPSDAAQAPALSALIQAFAWRRVVPVFEDTEFHAGLIPYLVDALAGVSVQVPYRSAIASSATDDHLAAELYRLKTMQTRVFVVHMSISLAGRLFAAAAAAEMMQDGYAWFITDKLTSLLGLVNISVVKEAMDGVIGLKPYAPKTAAVEDFRRRWRRRYLGENPNTGDLPELNTFGLFAYDTVWAVAEAVEAAGPLGTSTRSSSPANASTDLAAISVSNTGEKLLESIKKTEFYGLTGRFGLVDGELNVSVFQIVNLNDGNAVEIGFWTPGSGLSRRLVANSTKGYNVEMDSLKPVIWPGERTGVPKGWEMPTSGKVLKIAVPGTVKPGFQSFLKVVQDEVTNETKAGGFIIEVFEAAVGRLPYALPVQYFGYMTADGQSTGTYDSLVEQVYLRKYDAVVGDTTITSNRSKFVDFTVPYAVAGISMVVPLRNQRNNNAWIFLKPLTADLWLASFGFFILTGLVIWVLEHRINPEFRGPPANQVGTIFYFAFSTLVFAHSSENIVSNLARVVVIIWVFVVLILTSSYTASLTSMLTVQQFQPSYTDIMQLKNSGEYVGYLKDSFVKGFLIKQGFDQSKLKAYRSPEEYADALAKGSWYGGVAAVVDEIPYLRVFLKDYCQNYTIAEQVYKTGGFGFVFPKGSPLVPDLSRAILNITEGGRMTDIERRWFGDQTNCANGGSQLGSNSLDLGSFWGLFLITGTASALAFCIYWIVFLYKHRHYLSQTAPNSSSLRRRISSIAKLFDEKDPSCDTFKSNGNDGSNRASPLTYGSTSPMSFSAHTFEEGSPSSVEPATPFSGAPVRGEITVSEG